MQAHRPERPAEHFSPAVPNDHIGGEIYSREAVRSRKRIQPEKNLSEMTGEVEVYIVGLSHIRR
jgi:hypothetical protein